MLTISLGVVVAATITIPVRIYQQKQSLCIDSDYMSGELADINQLNCLNSGNPFNSKYGVGKIYVKSLSNDTGLILHLTFDDCSIEDLSGLENTPTENNVTCVNSIFGKGIKFNGIDSKLIANYNPSLDSDRITISVWLKIDEITSTETIVSKSDYPSSGYFLRIEPGTSNGVKITFFIGDSTGSSHEVIADNQNITGRWVHLVAVYDGNEQAIWVNGKKASSSSWSGDIGLNTKNLEIGDEYGSNYFDGVIDEIAIYNRGLSENEIKALFYDKLLLLTSTYDAKYMIDNSKNVDENKFETEIFLNNQYYLNKTFTLEVPVPDDANASVFYPYVSGYIDIKELSSIGHGEWNYSIERFDYGVKNRLIINATLAGADGFDNGIKDFNPDTFFYKREITINNSANSENLTDYQIKINIDTTSLITQGKMNDDCGDIRFYYYDNSTGSEEKIPYWIKPGTCNTTSTEIWFKVPYIPANGIAKVYMYYGNPSAVSESNGDAVFLISHTVGEYGRNEYLTSVTTDDEYIYAAGYNETSSATGAGDKDGIIVKFDKNMKPINQKLLSGSASYVLNVIKYYDGYIYTAGRYFGSGSGMFMIKFDKSLNIINITRLDDTNLDQESIEDICFDGNYIYAVGHSYNESSYSLVSFVLKLDKDLDVINKSYIYIDEDSEAFSIACDNDSIYVAGTGGAQYDDKIYILRMDKNLTIKNDIAFSFSLKQKLTKILLSDEYLYVTGFYDKYGFDYGFIFKFNKTLGFIKGVHFSYLTPSSIYSDGLYLYTSHEGGVLLKLDKDLNVVKRKNISPSTDMNDIISVGNYIYAVGGTILYDSDSPPKKYNGVIILDTKSMETESVYPDSFSYSESTITTHLDNSISPTTLTIKTITPTFNEIHSGVSSFDANYRINDMYIAKRTQNEPSISIGNEEINEVDEIQISTDFLKIIVNKNFYQDRSHPVSIIVNDKENNFLYEINLSDITVDDSKVCELYPNYKVYFYDWEAQKWKVWEKGVNNSTHGVPNWLDPVFRQELKWRFSFENNSNTNVSLNVTFLVTSHDPFIRVFIDAGDQLSSMEHSVHIPIKTREKKYYASIFNNTFGVYDSSNISSLNILSSHRYRKPILINNSANNQNLTDYQLAINISYNPHMQSDFDDIRFTYVNSTDNSETKISYWIEQKVDSSWAYVWIKLPFIPDNQTDIGFGKGIAKVYMYYGNPSATSESNGDDVFLFFDDFDGTSLNTSKWTDASGTITLSGGVAHLQNGAYLANGGITSSTYQNKWILEGRFKWVSGGDGCFEFAPSNSGDPNGVGLLWDDGYQSDLEVNSGGEISILPDHSWNNHWVRGLVKYNEGSTYGWTYVEDTDTEGSASGTSSDASGWHLLFHGSSESYVDYIFIRKYAEQEPAYSIQQEESLYKKDSSVNVLYDRSSTDIVLFFTENSKSIGLSLYNTSSDKLDLIEYKIIFSNSRNILISLGYTNPINTTTGNLSTWTIGFSNETLEKVGNSTLTYYDIISWKKSGDYNSVQHNVSLVFHYNDTYKDDYGVGWYNYTGIEDSTSFTGNLVSNRSVNGNVHRIVDADISSYIVFNLTDHDSASQSDYDQRRIKIVVDYPAQKATYLLLDSLDERYGIRNQNNAYIILANNDNSNQIFLSSSERGLYSFSSNKSSIKEVELNLSAFHTGLTLGYIASDTTKDSDNDNIPDLLEDEESIGFSSSEKLTDFTKSSLGYYALGYDGYKFIATFAYLDNEFSYTPFYLLGLRQPVGVENAYEIGYRTSNGATWYMFKSQPIAKFHLNSTSVAQTSNMIKYVTFKQKNITIYPEDELYIEGLPTTLSGEGEITYTKSNFLPKAELKLYVKYNQTMSYWVNYILPASADYLIIEISNPEKTHFSMKYNITNHDKITIPTNSWINDYWYNINSSCYSKNDIRYGMICSDASPEEVAVALVAGYGIADSLCYRNSTKYTLSLNTTSDKIIIPLTDNCKMVVNKMRSIETYGIPTTSFNEETAKSNYVTMTLSYDKIKVLGGLSFSNGYYRLCVRNVGREYGTTLVEIVRC